MVMEYPLALCGGSGNSWSDDVDYDAKDDGNNSKIIEKDEPPEKT